MKHGASAGLLTHPPGHPHTRNDVRVGFLTSWEERCGIAGYSRLLVEALRPLVEVDVVPASFRRSPRAVYQAMGAALNTGAVAHVQHSYAFFGGMHPVRSGWSALAGAVRRPLLVTVHELDDRPTGAYHLPSPVELAYKRWFNRSTFLHPAVRRWLVHSLDLRDALEALGAPPGRITYRPMPVELPAGAALDPEAARAELGLRGKRPLVILGFLARRKGYDVALQALRELSADYVLVAAGGEHAADRSGTEAWLRAEAERAGVGDRLRITGYLSESGLDHVTRAAELILAPFHEMSGSASLAYALARGKAVVASDLRENRELECVRLVPPSQPEALRAAVEELAKTPRRRRELEQAALEYARQNSYPALAEETRGLYDQLLAGDGR